MATFGMSFLEEFNLEANSNFSRLGSTSPFETFLVFGNSMSLVGIVFTFLTYCIFSDLHNLATVSFLNLLGTVFLFHLIAVFGVETYEDVTIYIALAFIFHYLRLSMLFWLTSMSFDLFCLLKHTMDLMENTSNLSTGFWKTTLACWGSPGVLLSLSIYIEGLHSKTLGIPNPWTSFCMQTMLFTFLIPAVILFAFNLVALFKAWMHSLYTIHLQTDKGMVKLIQKWTNQRLILQTKLVIMFFTISFICFGSLFPGDTRWEAVYLSAISMTGVIVSISFIFNCTTLHLYWDAFKWTRKSLKMNYGLKNTVKKTASIQQLTMEKSPEVI